MAGQRNRGLNIKVRLWEQNQGLSGAVESAKA